MLQENGVNFVCGFPLCTDSTRQIHKVIFDYNQLYALLTKMEMYINRNQ